MDFNLFAETQKDRIARQHEKSEEVPEARLFLKVDF